ANLTLGDPRGISLARACAWITPDDRCELFGMRPRLPHRLAFHQLGIEHVIDRVREIISARHGNDDYIAATSTILRDSQEFSPVVFSQVYRDELPLDLKHS